MPAWLCTSLVLMGPAGYDHTCGSAGARGLGVLDVRWPLSDYGWQRRRPSIYSAAVKESQVEKGSKWLAHGAACRDSTN
eukprot:scaffold557171_cov34-Prasinocladus_malaysianus.AAC.1